jgi:hypothetical protein
LERRGGKCDEKEINARVRGEKASEDGRDKKA